MTDEAPQDDWLPAQLVKWLRRQYGSQDKLAAALGMNDKSTVHRWEKAISSPGEKYRVQLAALPPAAAAGLTPDRFRVPAGTEAVHRASAMLEQQIEVAQEVLAGLRVAGKRR